MTRLNDIYLYRFCFSMHRHDAASCARTESSSNDAWPGAGLPAIPTAKPSGQYKNNAYHCSNAATLATDEHEAEPTATAIDVSWWTT